MAVSNCYSRLLVQFRIALHSHQTQRSIAVLQFFLCQCHWQCQKHL